MKKGKRQFVQKNQLMGSAQQQRQQNQKPTLNKTQIPKDYLVVNNQKEIANINVKISPNNEKHHAIDMEERKKKIELFKQKYIKKNQPSTQHQSQSVIAVIKQIPISEKVTNNSNAREIQSENINQSLKKQQQKTQPILPIQHQIKKNIMKEILIKKLEQQTNSSILKNGKNKSNKNDPFQLKGQYPQPQYEPKQQNIHDNQYQNQIHPQQKQEIKSIQKQPPIIDFKLAYTHYFNNNNDNALKTLYKNHHPTYNTIIEPDGLSTINLNSLNSQLADNTKKLIKAFAISNKLIFSEDQKQAIYDTILQYYLTDNKMLSDIFLVLLVKVGRNYLNKYLSFFKTDLNYHLRIVAQWKLLFLPPQIQQFCEFYLEDLNVEKQDDLVLLLFLASKNEKVIKKIYSSKLEKPINVLTVLCLIKPNKQNELCLTLYLKLINSIIEDVKEMGMLQKLLACYKQIQFPQKLYTLNKNVLSKIIKEIPNKNQETGGGFLGYFNKAISKLKTNVTPNITSNTQDQLRPQSKQQQINDQGINGQVVEDLDTKVPKSEQSIKRSVPPPPPPRNNRQPPPGPKKDKFITNTSQ